MKRECSGREVSDVTIQRGKENHKFTFISEEINVRNFFWNISKYAIVCTETTFSKNYYTETRVSVKTIYILKERYFQADINSFPANVSIMNKPGSWFLVVKCVKKHLLLELTF